MVIKVTWALGHLVHFAEPDDYDAGWAGRWSMGQLPMIPEQWKLRTDKKTVKQFKVVKALLTSRRPSASSARRTPGARAS
jgi:DNA topoisomerase-3